MVRTAVLVSGGGTNLQALLDASGRGALPSCAICLVVSDRPGAYALQRAAQAGVEAAALGREASEGPEAYGARLLALLKGKGIELVVLAGFLTILDPCVVRAYENRILNVHPSLIPAFCGKGYYGLRVHEAALTRGVKMTGATVHLVNEIPDGGPILAQKAVPVLEGDSPQSLQKRVMEEAEWVLLPQAVEQVAQRMLREESA
ncbi:MAG: phosphoribosylglycinamide formyltransferase [Candidatus Limiplasma sp.]|nr:phosphoribosylglycinamide formyltransferase [Candidatus Limiplasma sp.]